jgi:hypothetical protein
MIVLVCSQAVPRRGAGIHREGCADTPLLTDLIINWLAKPMSGLQGDQSVLDEKRYYAAFPDENPANRKPILRHSPALMAALRALEKEVRLFIPTTKAED